MHDYAEVDRFEFSALQQPSLFDSFVLYSFDGTTICSAFVEPCVESRKGAGPGPNGDRWFPFPAHQTGRARFEHPAFRQRRSCDGLAALRSSNYRRPPAGKRTRCVAF